MNAVKGIRATLLVPSAAFVVVAALAVAGLAGSAKADFTLTAAPAGQSVQQGQIASFTITASKNNGFSSPISLTATGLPVGMSATFSPQLLDTKATSTFAVSVGANVSAQAYTLTVSATGGGVTHTVTMGLTVTSPPAQNFTLAASPPSVTMLPGDTAAYTITTSGSSSGAVSFALAGAPTGATATFQPASVAVGGSTQLQVATKNSTLGGNYTLTITGTSAAKQQTVSVPLTLSATGKQFVITLPIVDPITGLAAPAPVPGPDGSSGLNLSLWNPNGQALQVSNLTVAIQSVSKAASAPENRPCTAADYSVLQFSGSYPISIAGGKTVMLGSRFDTSTWPRLKMLNTSENQDGCKGATVHLTFTGSGQG
jgi:hypothetical protein